MLTRLINLQRKFGQHLGSSAMKFEVHERLGRRRAISIPFGGRDGPKGGVRVEEEDILSRNWRRVGSLV